MEKSAILKILNPLLTAREKIHATVVDRSDPRATLRLAEPMLVGTVVQVRFHDRIALGEVRRCEPDGGEYEIIIEFQDVMTMGEAE